MSGAGSAKPARRSTGCARAAGSTIDARPRGGRTGSAGNAPWNRCAGRAGAALLIAGAIVASSASAAVGAPRVLPGASRITSATGAAASTSPDEPRAAEPLEASGLPSAAAWTTASRRARSYARSRGSRVRFALRVDSRAWSFRGRETTHANSLVKATVLVAYLRRGSVRDRDLTARERALLTPMITRSANGPVSTLLRAMGGLEPLRRVGRLVGMRDFRPVSGFWGASRISAVDEARLFARLWSVLPPRHREYALGLLGSVVPEQRWGMPQVAPRGWQLRFKSGWNDRGRVVQAMRLTCRGHVISAAVLVDGDTHAGSIATIEETGRLLLRPLTSRGRDACASLRRPAS